MKHNGGMDKSRVNIAIIESSQIVWEGLSNLLLKSNSRFFVYRFGNIDELQRFLAKEKADVVIVNPSVIQNKECEFAKTKKNFPETDWIALVYSFYDKELLSKFDDSISVTDSLESIVSKISHSQNSNSNIPQSEDLTEREVEVLVLLTKGYSNKEIADKLNISVHTVISHRKNIVEKTDIKSLSGLTIYAISKKLITIES